MCSDKTEKCAIDGFEGETSARNVAEIEGKENDKREGDKNSGKELECRVRK
jgi:hypothetical protein